MRPDGSVSLPGVTDWKEHFAATRQRWHTTENTANNIFASNVLKSINDSFICLDDESSCDTSCHGNLGGRGTRCGTGCALFQVHNKIACGNPTESVFAQFDTGTLTFRGMLLAFC